MPAAGSLELKSGAKKSGDPGRQITGEPVLVLFRVLRLVVLPKVSSLYSPGKYVVLFVLFVITLVLR